MAVTVTVIAMLCLAGIAFNVRFLVALRKESKAVLNEQHSQNGGKTINQLLGRHKNGLGVTVLWARSTTMFDNTARTKKGYF